jgi:hypothetical protein
MQTVIDIYLTTTLSLTETPSDNNLVSLIDDLVGDWEGLCILFHGDHNRALQLGDITSTKYIPFPAAFFGECSVFNRDRMAQRGLLYLSCAKGETLCTITILKITG